MNKEIMKQAGFEKEVKIVENIVCPICCKPVDMSTEFRNDRSRREFEISGMCQKCQNDVFGTD